MEKLITIKPLDISEVHIKTASPTTKIRTKISKDTVNKFINFNETKKGAIEEKELLSIKPDLNVEALSEYEENLSLEKLLFKINKANKVLRKYGYVNLCISPDNVKKLINNEELVEENKKLSRENTAIKETLNEASSLETKKEENIMTDDQLDIDDINLMM